MRWAGLFDDLEAQADALAAAERAAEVETRTRGEIASLTVVDRLRAAVDSALRLHLRGGTVVRGTVTRVGPDWLLLTHDSGRETVVASAHVVRVAGLGRLSVTGNFRPVEAKLRLRWVLRGIARDRSAVRVHLADVDRPDAPAVLDATIDRVGSDFVELAVHSPGEPRRRAEVRAVELVPTGVVAAVSRLV